MGVCLCSVNLSGACSGWLCFQFSFLAPSAQLLPSCPSLSRRQLLLSLPPAYLAALQVTLVNTTRIPGAEDSDPPKSPAHSLRVRGLEGLGPAACDVSLRLQATDPPTPASWETLLPPGTGFGPSKGQLGGSFYPKGVNTVCSVACEGKAAGTACPWLGSQTPSTCCRADLGLRAEGLPDHFQPGAQLSHSRRTAHSLHAPGKGLRPLEPSGRLDGSPQSPEETPSLLSGSEHLLAFLASMTLNKLPHLCKFHHLQNGDKNISTSTLIIRVEL